MSEKVVLPKFDLPGQGPHPAVRMLWIAGGLMGVALLVLGGALWRHHSMQLAVEARAQAMIAARAAEAAAVIEAAKAREAEAAAKIVAAKAAKEAAKLAAAAEAAKPASGGEVASASSKGKSKSSSRHGKTSAKGGKAVAAAAKTEDKKPSGSKRDDAAIDKLLASFK